MTSPAESTDAGRAISSLLAIGSVFTPHYSSSGAAFIKVFYNIMYRIHSAIKISELKGKIPIPWKDSEVPVDPEFFQQSWTAASVLLTELEGELVQDLLPKPSKRLRAVRESPKLYEELQKARDKVFSLWNIAQNGIKFAQDTDPATIKIAGETLCRIAKDILGAIGANRTRSIARKNNTKNSDNGAKGVEYKAESDTSKKKKKRKASETDDEDKPRKKKAPSDGTKSTKKKISTSDAKPRKKEVSLLDPEPTAPKQRKKKSSEDSDKPCKKKIPKDGVKQRKRKNSEDDDDKPRKKKTLKDGDKPHKKKTSEDDDTPVKRKVPKDENGTNSQKSSTKTAKTKNESDPEAKAKKTKPTLKTASEKTETPKVNPKKKRVHNSDDDIPTLEADDDTPKVKRVQSRNSDSDE